MHIKQSDQQKEQQEINQDNQSVKDKVIETISKVTTKSFLDQSCYVTSIENNIVTIEVGSRFLQEVGRRQLDIIEEGFTLVLGEKTKVIIQENKFCSYNESPIKLIELEYNVVDLLYSYDNDLDITLAVNDFGFIDYSAFDKNTDGSIVIVSNAMIPFSFYGIGQDDSVLETIGEKCTISIPYIMNKKLYELYSSITNSICLSIPYNNYISSDIVTWGDIVDNFNSWGGYLAYCQDINTQTLEDKQEEIINE
jgi:hypothetical protein